VSLHERVAELLRSPGEQKQVSRTMNADGLAVSDSSVPDGSTLRFEAVLDSLGDSIAVSGTVTYDWVGECRRCLGPVGGEGRAEVREVYSSLGDDDTFPLDGDDIDLGPLISEAVMLDLPVAPLCSDDCRGPAPDDYPAEPLADPDPDAEPPRDPRWAALDDLDLS